LTKSAVYIVVESPSSTLPISKGKIIPPYHGNVVSWKIVMYDLTTKKKKLPLIVILFGFIVNHKTKP
jgi:hypothetical protein